MATQSQAEPPQQPLPSLESATLSDLDPETTARATLSLLETRLRRLEFLLTGVSDHDGRPIGPKTTLTGISPINLSLAPDQESQPDTTQPTTDTNTASEPSQPQKASTIPARLAALESSLTKLKRLDGLPGTLVRTVDGLHSRHPYLFNTLTTPSVAPSQRDTLHKSNTVLSSASAFHAHSSGLQTLTTLHIPPASQSTDLIAAGPRVQALREKQRRLESEARELQARSARALEWWVKTGVLGMGEVWEEWEDRVEQTERVVRRAERRVKEENQL